MELTGPCGWEPVVIPGGPCAVDPNDPQNSALVAQAQQVASALLWRLTGFKYGACSVTVRPCKPKTCDPLTLSQVIYWDSRPGPLGLGANGNLGVLSFFPTLVGGEVFNISCGCPQGCCKCEADCEVKLPGPIVTVTDVTVDGTPLATDQWRVYDDAVLVIDSDACPGCQNYNLNTGDVGTWSVTYSLGTLVPDELNLAAGLYANEWMKSLSGDKNCALPARVQTVARQGVTTGFIDPTKLVNAGLTGVPRVDDILRALNPYALKSDSVVWFPGCEKIRKQTQ